MVAVIDIVAILEHAGCNTANPSKLALRRKMQDTTSANEETEIVQAVYIEHM